MSLVPVRVQSPAPIQPARFSAIDKVRGLAIVAMIVDHLTLVLSGPDLLRLSVGRVAMPLFFLVAGSLASRLRWRHLQIFGLGILLPIFVPWIDNPNVLVWWAFGSLLLWLFDGSRFLTWLVVAAPLVVLANGWDYPEAAGSYEPTALIALMALGRLLGPSMWEWGSRLPELLSPLGRHPLSIYVGHVLVLQGVSLWVLA